MSTVEDAVAELERIATAIAEIHDPTVGPSAAGGHAIDQALNRFPEAVAALRAVLNGLDECDADIPQGPGNATAHHIARTLRATIEAALGGAS